MSGRRKEYSNMKRKLFVAGALLLLQIPTYACNVPVFRYALERWPVSPYRALVVNDAALTVEEKASLTLLEKAGDGDTGALNLVVWNPNKEELEKSGMAKQLPKSAGKDAMVHLFYPASTGIDQPFWSAPMTKSTVQKIRGSTFRKSLIKKILEGNSGVFVLLESGDKVQDSKVKKKLDAVLKELAAEMKLPDGVVGTDGEVTGGGPAGFDPTDQLRSEIPLKMAFTSLRLSRKKEDEVLVALMTNLGPKEVKESDKPMVFAVYGRCRTLVPMVGEEITTDNLGNIAYFFTGACSCQVKSLNPGMDMLMDHDWDLSVFGGYE